MPSVPQINVPEEMRNKIIPGYQGSLKIIKVLTNEEFKELKEPNKPITLEESEAFNIKLLGKNWKERLDDIINKKMRNKKEYNCEWRVKRASCSHFASTNQICWKKMIDNPTWKDCSECTEHEPKSKWQIHFDIAPIDTDVEIPRPRRIRKPSSMDLNNTNDGMTYDKKLRMSKKSVVVIE